MKNTKNPKIIELTKSHRERTFSLGRLKAIKIDGSRYCVWCAEGKLHHGSQKYCSPACSGAAMAWGYPQGVESAGVLLVKQGYKCASCAFDYGTVVEGMLRQPKVPYGCAKVDPATFRATHSYWLVKRLKEECRRTHPDRRIEVDHILPIFKGGSPLDRGNLQLICFSCHKQKTRVDNSGPRKAKLKAKTKQQLLEEVELLNEEIDALKNANDSLSAHVEQLMGEKDWD